MDTFDKNLVASHILAAIDAYRPAPSTWTVAKLGCADDKNTWLIIDGVPIDNNSIENQVHPEALGRKNWLFAGSQRSGQRTANVMSLIQTAKVNGLDPQAYLRDVLERLPTAKLSDLDELLPHNWGTPIKV